MLGRLREGRAPGAVIHGRGGVEKSEMEGIAKGDPLQPRPMYPIVAMEQWTRGM